MNQRGIGWRGVVALVLLGAGCGARTDLSGSVDASARSPIEPDAGPLPCAALFEDCDGSVEDCGAAFVRGCACGEPPSHLFAEPHVTRAYNSQIQWSGSSFVVSVSDRGADVRPETVLLDPTGRHELRRFPQLTRRVVGGQMIANGGPRGPALLDLTSGEIVRHYDSWNHGSAIAVGNGELAGLQAERVPGSDDRVAFRGVFLGRHASELEWSAPLTVDVGRRIPHVWSLAWNGRELMAGVGNHFLIRYSVADGRLSAVRFREPVGSYFDTTQPFIHASPRGSVLVWGEGTRPGNPHEMLRLTIVGADGAIEESTTWTDPEAVLVGDLGVWHAVHDDEVSVLYKRVLADGSEDLALATFGLDTLALRSRRTVQPASRRPHGLVWAGYSLAYATVEFDSSPPYGVVGLRMHRICP